MILRALAALAAPAGARCRLSVFYFHRALAEPDPLLPFEPDARMFDRMLGWIGAQFRVLDPLEACDRLFDGTLPSRPAVVTFDDGYRDNYTVALPVLQRHRMQAAFFVATGFLEGGAMFNDRVIEAVRRCKRASLPAPEGGDALMLGDDAQRRAAIDRILGAIKHLPPEVRMQRVLELERAAGVVAPSGTMMRAEDVAALHRAGMRVGGHTRSHPILLKLDDAEAEREIAGGLDDLASILGERPPLFAYPNGKLGGDFDERHVAMVQRAGARYAFTTQAGAATRSSGRYLLPRFTPWDRTRWRFGLRAWRNLAGRRSAR
ncbi:MAG: polysaccharide deacetylase [Alphaproteobacteria bacterium]|nr:MAG: polysaccharide deacetylase [Alphaproteobacteria bacterium]